MGYITLGLGLVFLIIGLLSLLRDRIYVGGRVTRSKAIGTWVLAIAIPQAIAGLLAMVVGFAHILDLMVIGQHTGLAITVLVGTYLITNLGIGGYLQTKTTIEDVRKNRDS